MIPKSKICIKCKRDLILELFNNHKSCKYGKNSFCKECERIRAKIYNAGRKEEKRIYDLEYSKNNNEKKIIQSREYYEKNKIDILNKMKELKKSHPEKIILNDIKTRCNNKKCKTYKYYGGRGIECRITEEEIKLLIERDGYWGMKKPSIDRIDNDGHYELSNCQFLESGTNSAKDKGTPVLQYDLYENFIREFISIASASRELRIHHSGIVQNLKGKTKTSGGFIWRYKDAL